METLIELMKKVLADTFCLYLKTHNFHWNITGPNFPQYHQFFDCMYDELWDAIDPIAEHIRALDSFAPGSLKRFQELTEIMDELGIPEPLEMIAILQRDNDIVLKTLRITLKFATEKEQEGTASFLSDRIDKHEKLNWKLKSIGK